MQSPISQSIFAVGGRATISLVIFLCVTLGLISACTDFGEEPQPLSAYGDGQYLRLTNSTEDTLYYFFLPTNLVPIVDWVPCITPSACTDRVMPRGRVAIAYQDFWWLKNEGSYANITIFWWRLHRQPDGTYHYDQIQSVNTRI
jgi:hypothetical protein